MDDGYVDQKMWKLTLLYVEDEPAVREPMQSFFEARFARVDTAEDGVQGLEQFGRLRPDLVITDVRMPRMDGLAMIEAIRAADPLQPIIIMTAFSELETLARAIDLGVEGFIKKPVRRNELISALRRLTLGVIREHELRERDRIIQTILGWHPFFSIISEKDHIEHIGDNLLEFLGYASREEFVAGHCDINTVIESIEAEDACCYQDLSGAALFDYIAAQTDRDIIVYLKNRQGESRAYLLRTRYFEQTGLYFIAFIDPKSIMQAEKQCELSKLCTMCDFETTSERRDG